MTQKKAEILLATVIAARATSLLFSKIAMNGMGIFNLLAARFLMAFVLLAVVFFKRLRHIKRHTLVRGAIMGGLFFLMLSTELTGLKSTPSSTVSLLENTAIILVPMAEAVLRHKLPKAATAVSALVAIGGVALLTGQSGGFTPGMVLAVMAAVLYAAAIITTDRFSHEDDPLTLGIVQVGTLGLLALVSSFVFEAPHLPQSGTQWLMIAGLAVICTGFGFTLQPVAQSHTTAQRAGLFCALSPACATLLGARRAAGAHQRHGNVRHRPDPAEPAGTAAVAAGGEEGHHPAAPSCRPRRAPGLRYHKLYTIRCPFVGRSAGKSICLFRRSFFLPGRSPSAAFLHGLYTRRLLPFTPPPYHGDCSKKASPNMKNERRSSYEKDHQYPAGRRYGHGPSGRLRQQKQRQNQRQQHP